MINRNILANPLIKKGLTSRWPQLIGRGAALAVFIFVIISGLFGTPVGNRNLSIVLIWIAWWAALILVLVPFLGRGWCSICPLPLPGEWIQQGTILGPETGKPRFGKNWKWPKKLRNIWLQNGSFAMMALFSAVILTKPAVTAWLLLGMIAAAITMSLLFERRAFCRYLCPVGGFIGLYSLISPVELRIIEQDVCRDHKVKTCYTGNENGYGCPWNIYPGALKLNTNCGACFECLRTCPHDNIAINIRGLGADLTKPGAVKMDESFKAILMLGSATVYSAIMLGPWGELKSAAFSVGSGDWWIFAGSFLVINFIILPALFYLVVKITQSGSPSSPPLKYAFKAYSASLIPLGLGAWAAFSLSFIFTNGSYLWGVVSDPLGVGWNLLGTAGATWTPYLSGVTPTLEMAALVLGLFGAGQTAMRISKKGPEAWPALAYLIILFWNYGWFIMAANRIKKEILARILLGMIILGIPLGILIWGQLSTEPGLLVQASIPEDGGWNPGTIKAKVGQSLNLQFTSQDVVHGFSIGKLDFPEIDVLPGVITEANLVFSEPGRYVYYCTRWCSPNHWRMRGTIIVEGESQVEQKPDPPLYVVMGIDIDQDRQTKNIPEVTPSLQAGMDIMAEISRQKLEPYLEISYLKTHSPSEVWLSLSEEDFSDGLRDQDIWNLVAALWNANVTPESSLAGQQLYDQNCAACHGGNGKGDGIFAQKYSPGEVGSSGLLQDISSPADFTLSESMLATSSAILEGKILRGGMGTGMPNFGPIFSNSEIWSIIDHIWTFQFTD